VGLGLSCVESAKAQV